jgi:hypothetical protein
MENEMDEEVRQEQTSDATDPDEKIDSQFGRIDFLFVHAKNTPWLCDQHS